MRLRAIFDCDLNLVFKTTLAYCLKNKDQIRSCCHNGGDDECVFLQFDFKSFYDQFVLWLRVRRFFGLLGHDEMVYWLRLLPMGFRLAVAAAQATMWMFLNFPKSEKVNVATCIDNVCFSGKRSLVHPVVNTFLERVFSCGFTLNGWDGSNYLLLNLSERMSKLRETEGPNKDIPASSITAFARSQDRERALMAGFDAHLVKPIEPGELVAVVLSLAKRHLRKQRS